jgi:hypothetical protein
LSPAVAETLRETCDVDRFTFEIAVSSKRPIRRFSNERTPTIASL